ncbi:DNA mismatch repair endonuclease MutL [Paraglaciecola sp.]|uniref:DNA mismatch repair endonuclease MutL n=1 Tax=Paraglaciecola sp. TaxID=1920173 RepID=UPI003EF2C84A
MPIQILPARLANQIAAGEVVERPASVVKELVENSLDSGATHIEIEIEKGGHKRILLRDNGSGIVKDELALALSRHATSKISCLDDLEAICSLGFRGEALASISSVARLTLSSKPKDQQQAWQAHCEGRDMQVELNPVAHPNGTSVDVVDLFFNTPARRKFLKTEKTEFAHIDEVVRRIALSRFDVSLTLKHNGKLLRKYPAMQKQRLKRVAAICGKEFTEQSIELNSQYQDFELKGWLVPPSTSKNSNEFQYFYVNGRVMRDKLINHAIRQAIEDYADTEFSLSYVLYLTIEPTHVDVNVHPAKHEVRFHQARLVHDFIYRALADGLKQYFQEEQVPTNLNILKPIEPKHDYIQPLRVNEGNVEPRASERESYTGEKQSAYTLPESGFQNVTNNNQTNRVSNSLRAQTAQVAPQAHKNYQNLMQPSEPIINSVEAGQWLKLDEQHMLVSIETHFYMLKVADLHKAVLLHVFEESVPVSQPLLMPVSIDGNEEMLAQAKILYQPLLENSVEIGWTPNRILLRKVPAGFRQLQWAAILTDILECNKNSALDVRECLLTSIVKNSNITSNNQVHELWSRFVSQSTNIIQALQKVAKQVPLTQLVSNRAQEHD